MLQRRGLGWIFALESHLVCPSIIFCINTLWQWKGYTSKEIKINKNKIIPCNENLESKKRDHSVLHFDTELH